MVTRVRLAKTFFFLGLLAMMFSGTTAEAQNRRPQSGEPSTNTESASRNRQRPDRRFVRPPNKVDATRFFNERRPGSEGGEEFRTFNGTFNNLDRPRLGSIFIPLLRMAPADYGPNNSLARQDAVSARVISNAVSNQSAAVFNNRDLSDFIWQWGQFIDHDIDLTEFQSPEESAPIPIPLGDAQFDPLSGGDKFMPFSRSIYSISLFRRRVRQQLNEITAFIDGSGVYGSTLERANALRTFADGKLRTSDGGEFGDLLPLDDSGQQFLAGDIRAGEQAGLSCMHTLFVREHNRIADQLKAADGSLTDEEIYQRARKKVYAILESITYNEWLPALLGPEHPLSPYAGYDSSVSPNIANEFSTAAYPYWPYDVE